MGKMKAFWLDSCEKVLRQFEIGTLTHGEALEELERLNASPYNLEALEKLKRWYKTDSAPTEEIIKIKRRIKKLTELRDNK